MKWRFSVNWNLHESVLDSSPIILFNKLIKLKYMKKLVIGLGVVVTLILTFSISYYFLVLLPAQAEARLNFEKQKFENEKKAEEEKIAQDRAEALQRKEELSNCLNTAETQYNEDVKTACAWKVAEWQSDGTITKDMARPNLSACLQEPSKRLGSIAYSPLDEKLQVAKDECYKKYPIK